jgi:hypothetical protein
MKPSPPRNFSVLAAALALTALGAGVLTFALLRETPSFWRNAGGFPVELRDLVETGFYPALALYFVGLSFGSHTGWQELRAHRRSGGVLLLACCGLNWLLFFTITAVVLWNNVGNMMGGRPLHSHAP